ncbi:hypothetical protein N7474_010117, partial [Penicillium riverlandense]|uniref:uncharacterized protein n=1 Tax=Penicillium riverlandense TaxID=1903569 RepID=UPI002547B559
IYLLQIAWKLILNRKTVDRVTEGDLVIAPSDYWGTLKADVEEMLQTKKKRHQRVLSEGTAVTISVNDRSQRNLEKFYNSTNINWKPVEKQLRKWSNLLRIGRKLTIDVAFNYREDDDGHTMPSSRRVEKRGRVSATSRMLAECKAHIDAEEETTRRPSTWSLVYDRTRCGIRSCPLNLEGHDDVPGDIRRDLILESQTGRKSTKADASTTGLPSPSTIINVLLAQNGSASTVTSSLSRPPSDERLVIFGPREVAVREYCKWLESCATDEAYKADFRRICQVALENHLDLELILEDPDPGFFVQRGIRIGTARRFLRTINGWATATKLNTRLDQTAD